MSSFNAKTKTLILGNKKLDKIIDSYRESDSYISYNRYITEGLKKDIEEILIPEINKLSDNVKISLHDKSIIVEKDKDFSNSIFNKVRLSFLVPNMPDAKTFNFKDYETNPFLFFKLPYMEKSGILLNKDKRYTVINSLKLDDDITYDTKTLKVVDNGHSFTITGGINPKFEMFGTGVYLVDFIIMMYKYDYPINDSGKELVYDYLKNVVNTDVNNYISGKNKDYIRDKDLDIDTRDRYIRQLIGLHNDNKSKEFYFNEKIENGYLDTTNSRFYLNKILSLNNAIGKLISRDINKDNGETIVKKGSIITKDVVKILHKNLIDTIYVENIPSIGGQYIGDNILIGNILPKGTPICKELVRYFPELSNYTTAPRDFLTSNNEPIIILKDTLITNKLLDTLLYLGKNEFYYKESIKTKKLLIASFEEEYCNNRHFPVEDLDQDIINQIDQKPIMTEEDEENVDLEEYDDDDSIFGDYVFIDKNGNISKESNKLTCHDCVALLSLYTKLNTGKHYDLFSDPDLGLRKKVDQIYNHFHNSFISTTKKIIRMKQTTIKNYMSSAVHLKNVSKLEEIFKQFSVEFFRYLQSDLKVIDNLDITNPVSMISSLTKINTIVKDQDSIADSMRLLTMGHYGRICPYETPQSKKLGIVNNYASECIIEKGKMYTSYYKLENKNGNMYVNFNPIRMTIEEEENYRIADIRDIDYNDDGLILTKAKVLSRIPLKNSLEKMTIAYVDIMDVQYISISYNQHISIAGTTIPFAGGNDAARTTFGLAMVKQAKGLVKGEIPIINTTGFLNIVNMTEFYKIFAEDDGRVLELNSSSIIVLYKNNNMVKYEFEPMTLSFDTIVLRVVKVNKNDTIKKGQTLVSSNFVKDDCMVLGVNALVGYIIDGYNYEDGIPCSERVANKLTSYGVHSEKIPISKSKKSPAIINVNYNQYIEEDNTLFKLSSKSDTDIRTIISNRVMAKKSRGFIARAEFEQVDAGKEIKNTETKTVSFDKLNISDKICNRHGNKGIACNVYKNSEMEYFENGEIIDVKVNPLSIVSRMNMGQTLEAPLGLSCYVLGINILCSSFYSPSLEDSKMLLSYTVDLANSKDGEEYSIFNNYKNLPDELHKNSKENINKIRYWKNTFDKEGKAYLINPRSGKRTLTKVNVGVNYVYKLIQEGEEKIHSRGGYMTSPYVFKTDSPTKGASNEGGQRQGYMELDALAAHGASALLKEITNERSDNAVARNNVTVKAIHSDSLMYMLDDNKGIRRSSEYMFEIFRALGLNSEFTEEEINLYDKEAKSVYSKNTLKLAELGNSENLPKYKSIDEDEDELKRLMSELEKSLE
jgi:DNA-directed RNA polymerase beta subunit